jgi:Flp pilus assembly protein TadG
VEFALVAAPFITLLVGLLEISMIFIAMTTMEHGVSEAARRIRTGELQESGASAATFKQLICDNTFGLLNCNDRLKVDVRVFDNFGNTKAGSPIKDGAVDDSKLQFDAGSGSDIVLARVFYEWEIVTPLISKPLANLDGNKRLLQASVAFRNEPFGN